MTDTQSTKIGRALLAAKPSNGSQMAFIVHNKIHVQGQSLYDWISEVEDLHDEGEVYSLLWKLLWAVQDAQVTNLDI